MARSLLLLPQAHTLSRKEGKKYSWFDKFRWRFRSKCESKSVESTLYKSKNQTLSNRHESDCNDSKFQSCPKVPSSNSSLEVADQADSITQTDPLAAVPTDIWSCAYDEALRNAGSDVKQVISSGDRIETLLTRLQQTNEDLLNDSSFRKGLLKLRAPLENIKLAIDLASPLAGIHPAASTAVGIVSGVTKIAIAICGAEDKFNANIVRMLERIAIIDECDALDQRLGHENGIHKALVLVYKDLLNFYTATFEILNCRAPVFAMARNELSQRIPTIVEQFVTHADDLRARIANATLEILDDVQKGLINEKVQRLLGVDKHKSQNEIRNKLCDSRAIDACEWVTEDPRFLKWRTAPTSAQLVLFGHMGCGKTVTTTHVIEELIRLKTQVLPRPLICYYYCDSGERRTAVCIYSSLILQLIDQHQGLTTKFNKWYAKCKDDRQIDPACCSDELEIFLSDCVKSLDRGLFVVIDALDECDGDSRDHVLSTLDRLSSRTPRLKVFLSSRRDEIPEVFMKRFMCIDWIPDQQRDNIIAAHIVKKRLYYLTTETQALIIERLTELADGSAIWIELTSRFIQESKMQSMHRVKEFLNDAPNPTSLRQIYSRLFTQATGGDLYNRKIVTNALEILAIARRSLSIQELACSMALSVSNTNTQTLAQLTPCIDEQGFLHLLQPFLHHFDRHDNEKRQLRLMHKSLRDLILVSDPLYWSELQNTAREPQSATAHERNQRRSKMEASLGQICVKYLLFDEFNEMFLLSDEDQDILNLAEITPYGASDGSGQGLTVCSSGFSPAVGAKSPDEKELCYSPVKRGFGGFYAYASCFWLDHFKTSDHDHWPEIPDIVKLCAAGTKRLQNWMRQYHRPDCTIAARSTEPNSTQDPLTILSLYGSDDMLKMVLQDKSFIHASGNFLPNTIEQTITQIIDQGNLSKLSIIFKNPCTGREAQQPEYFHQLMRKWKSSDKISRSWTEAFDLVMHIRSDCLIEKARGNELLCQAASYGCLPVIERLFERASGNETLRQQLLQDIKRGGKNFPRHQSIGAAIWENEVEALRYMLKQQGTRAHLQHHDADGRNVFHMAARQCNPEVISLLIQHFPEGVNHINKKGDTPLCDVVFRSHSCAGGLESARLLLTEGHANVMRSEDEMGYNHFIPLRTAVRNGDIAMCRTLVKFGSADPRSALEVKDGRFQLLDSINGYDSEHAPKVLATLCSLACPEVEPSTSHEDIKGSITKVVHVSA